MTFLKFLQEQNSRTVRLAPKLRRVCLTHSSSKQKLSPSSCVSVFWEPQELANVKKHQVWSIRSASKFICKSNTASSEEKFKYLPPMQRESILAYLTRDGSWSGEKIKAAKQAGSRDEHSRLSKRLQALNSLSASRRRFSASGPCTWLKYWYLSPEG